ncbi:hypothetical protein VB773_08350 [Haloarculaceae archaeon H-GB2-1]|nr:hypothetical protein [Haloarculaceae archaeon H-GB1-1]MEA5386068.1 hypothetical protein [Haloarculaceae archaeon H-GB11]MEA5407575.1 hypothetical protein [Haloarculaceae archaeon H-GB2-1]
MRDVDRKIVRTDAIVVLGELAVGLILLGTGSLPTGFWWLAVLTAVLVGGASAAADRCYAGLLALTGVAVLGIAPGRD